ncbi:E1-E2 ATPase-domain-containing protein [Radiomyces spectabilis]|uniref:E1-E2 ATPase-domain-containing protein n=1 Tax=Radiomyces spectabilis TaxID=64574 RepID=UPI00221EF2C0|nr:E1-E2 ATPase-domain-containing protein [Radiomyces spectabilis]KAI8373026.1 E1-E2 ATPase-domain-containing protein [Radiomyces spectabilis]
MTCSHCSDTVTKALSGLPNVIPGSIHVSIDDNCAFVAFTRPNTVSKDQLTEIIEDLGYTVDNVILDYVSEEVASSGDPATEKTAVISISGMTCSHCVQTVNDALRGLPGAIAESVNTNLQTQEATVSFTGTRVTSDSLRQIIEDLGYEVVGRPKFYRNHGGLTDRRASLELTPTRSTVSATESTALLSRPDQKHQLRKVVMRVLGMTCHSCVVAVTDALQTGIPGVHKDSVRVDLNTEMAMFIATDPKSENIRSVVENRGYDVENIQIIHNLLPPAVLESTPPSEDPSSSMSSTRRPSDSIASLAAISVETPMAVPKKVTLSVSGMTCSSCVRTLERGLTSLPSVDPTSVQVQLLTGSASFAVMGDVLDEKTIMKAVKSMGYEASNIVFIAEQQPVQASFKTSMYKADLLISGMFCEQCVDKVHSALADLPGTKADSIKVDVDSGRASFDYSGESVGRQHIYQAILQLGFMAENIDIVKTGEEKDVKDTKSNVVTTRLTVTGMTCSSCVGNIERTMLKQAGVISCQVNLLAKSAVIQHDPSVVGSRALANMIEQIGYKAELATHSTDGLSDQREAMRASMEQEIKTLRFRFLWSLLFAIPTVLIHMIFMMALPASNPVHKAFMKDITHGLTVGDLLLFLMATPVQFWLGSSFYVKAYRSLVYARTANMETLVAMGTTVAYLASVVSVILSMVRQSHGGMSMNYFETSVLLITFIHFGKWLEALAKGKTAETITKLMDLQPERAILVEIAKNLDDKSKDNDTKTPSAKGGDDFKEDIFIETEIDTSEIQVGDILKVNAGARIPCDGKIWRGTTTTDESMITGESVPVNKQKNDNVITATINLSSPVYIRAIRVGSDTTLSRIIQMVQDAQASAKAPIEKLADQISSVFVPVVIALAIITYVVWQIASVKNLYPEDWLPEGETKTIFSIMLGVSVLVIACPCGLGLASPTAVMVGTGIAARYGVLVKGGGYALEMANRITTVAFDKTGTLTLGKPMVTDEWIAAASTEQTALQSIWKILGRVTSVSNHPLSKSIEKKAKRIIRGVDQNVTTAADLAAQEQEEEEQEGEEQTENTKDYFGGVNITNAKEVAGRGILATLTLSEEISRHLPVRLQGQRIFNVFLGNQEWMDENHARYENAEQAKTCQQQLGDWQDQGKSIVMISLSPVTTGTAGTSNKSSAMSNAHKEGCNNACACAVCHCAAASVCCSASRTMMLAQLAVADIARPESRQVVAELRKRNIEVWMVTGDNERTGRVVAQQLGIDKDCVLAGVKPEQKADKVRNLQRRGVRTEKAGKIWRKKNKDGKPQQAVVAMIGDGINDSPALAQADVGISVGSATDVAIEAASIVLIRNNLLDLLTMYDVSRVVVRRIRLNFFWAFLYNCIAIPIAAGITYPGTGQGLPTYVAGIAMVASSISVVCSSLLLRFYKPPNHSSA